METDHLKTDLNYLNKRVGIFYVANFRTFQLSPDNLMFPFVGRKQLARPAGIRRSLHRLHRNKP